MFCPRCGNRQEPDAAFCERCGEPLATAELATSAAAAQASPPPPAVIATAPPPRRRRPIAIAAVATIAAAVVLVLVLSGAFTSDHARSPAVARVATVPLRATTPASTSGATGALPATAPTETEPAATSAPRPAAHAIVARTCGRDGVGGDCQLSVRARPSSDAGEVRRLDEGDALRLSCQVRGASVHSSALGASTTVCADDGGRLRLERARDRTPARSPRDHAGSMLNLGRLAGAGAVATLALTVSGAPGATTPTSLGQTYAQSGAAATPAFAFSARRLTAKQRHRLNGSSWHAGCPVGLDDLRYVRLRYVGFDGAVHRGELVVNADAVGAVRSAFATLYAERFPIRRMHLVDDYGASDYRSIEADNTSAFNCRRATGATRWSQHAYGRAVDVNTIENPYIYADGTTTHAASRPYRDRARHRKGMAYAGGVLVRAFARAGWGWGGSWPGPTDYQHFSANGT